MQNLAYLLHKNKAQAMPYAFKPSVYAVLRGFLNKNSVFLDKVFSKLFDKILPKKLLQNC